MMKAILSSRTNQRQQGIKTFERIPFFQGFLLPGLWVLMLDRHASRVADESIRMRQVGPGGFDGGRVGVTVITLQLLAQSVQRTRRCLSRHGSR